MDEGNPVRKKPSLAPANLNQYFENLRQQGEEDERSNKGFVWTISMDGTSTITVGGLAKVDYTMNLSCSHVGETMFGVYRGEMDFKVSGDISGVIGLLAVTGFKAGADVDGWFKNDRFVMNLKPYSAEEDEWFDSLFKQKDLIETPAATGDAVKDAASQAVAEALSNLIGNILKPGTKPAGSTAQNQTPKQQPSGLWYDWDFHMTEGDMGMFLKVNGGPLLAWANGKAEVDASGSSLDADMRGGDVFGHVYSERYTEPIYNPFPYTLRVYPNGRVHFKLYNSKGGPLTADWFGFIDRIPVSQTIRSGE